MINQCTKAHVRHMRGEHIKPIKDVSSICRRKMPLVLDQETALQKSLPYI